MCARKSTLCGESVCITATCQGWTDSSLHHWQGSFLYAVTEELARQSMNVSIEDSHLKLTFTNTYPVSVRAHLHVADVYS